MNKKTLGNRETLAEAVGLGSMLLLVYFLIAVIHAGLTTGRYAIILEAPFGEAYFELFLVIAGLFWYIRYRKIRFTLHPEWQKDKKFSGLLLQKNVISYEGKEMV
jgi:hypothetical protein